MVSRKTDDGASISYYNGVHVQHRNVNQFKESYVSAAILGGSGLESEIIKLKKTSWSKNKKYLLPTRTTNIHCFIQIQWSLSQLRQRSSTKKNVTATKQDRRSKRISIYYVDDKESYLVREKKPAIITKWGSRKDMRNTLNLDFNQMVGIFEQDHLQQEQQQE